MATTAQMQQLLIDGFRTESITAYNRLESRARTRDFDRSLKAEVRDALWMLTRQWQFGEFKGEDAATAVTTQLGAEHTRMDRVYFPGDAVFSYDEKIPLETIVERETLRGNLFLAVQMGRYFIKLMKDASLPAFNEIFQILLNSYPISIFDVSHPDGYRLDENDREGKQLLLAARGKCFDGFLLHRDIIMPQDGATVFLNWLAIAAVPDSGQLVELSELFSSWYYRNYSQPTESIPPAWQPSKLEYSFTVSSAAKQQEQKSLVAERYHNGHLDWYSFDLNRNIKAGSLRDLPGEPIQTRHLKSYIPFPVAFKGMPNPRYWMMEEGQTDFAKIDTTPTGLLHLLMAEFGLTYSNDWFMIPYELSTNTLCEIQTLIVKDVFNLITLIRPAGTAAESQWHKWAMFRHTDTSNSPSNSNLFYLAPAITKLQQGEPTEVVNFLRDEMANMVWAVEKIVPSQAGKGVNGNEMALAKELPPAFVGSTDAKIRYVLGTTVPANWIPFIPVHMDSSITEIQLQRASLPHAKAALGTILTETPPPYYVREEMIQRSGILVSQLFQRTRGNNGETILWLGRMKEAGKGEGWSNLKFDQIENIP